MGPDALTIANGIAVFIMALSGIALCLTVTVVVIKLYPSIRRTVSNLEKTTESTVVTAENTAVVSASMAANANSISGDLSVASAKGRETMESAAEAANNLAAASRLLGSAGTLVDVANAVKSGVQESFSAQQKEAFFAEVKSKLRSEQVSDLVDNVTGKIGRVFRRPR